MADRTKVNIKWAKLKHKLGICHKARLGYSCKGSRNYKECE